MTIAPVELSADSAGYRRPSQNVIDLLETPRPARPFLSPSGEYLLIVQPDDLRSLKYLSQPMLKFAGMRVYPANNSQVKTRFYREPVVKRLRDGASTKLKVPATALFGLPAWSHDGTKVALPRYTNSGVELWLADCETGEIRDVTGPRVNATLSPGYRQVERKLNASWSPDSRYVFVHLVPENRGAAPRRPEVPRTPVVLSTSGRYSQESRWEDLLQNSHDERLLEYYCTSQLYKFDAETGKRHRIGSPGMFFEAPAVSPDGRFILVHRVKRPYSYWIRYREFANSIEVWNNKGQLVRVVFDLPPTDAVDAPPRPRGLQWQPLEEATLIWSEDIGPDEPARESFRDRIQRLSAPFEGTPEKVLEIQHRFDGFTWLSKRKALLTQYEGGKKWSFLSLVDLDKPDALRPIADFGKQDRYGHPGSVVLRTTSRGEGVALSDGDWIYFSGVGGTPQGDRPFLDRFNITTFKRERIFRSGDDHHEAFLSFAGPSRDVIATSYETPSTPRNYYLHNLKTGERKALTTFPHPYPQFKGVSKQLVKYTREDDVQLSGTLYLPADYQSGQRLPLVIWAYPREYANRDIASQVRIGPNRFTSLRGSSPPYSKIFALQGFAVLDGAEMPIVAHPRAVHDTYLEQLTSSARAAIHKVNELGLIDPKRVGMIGHSYGGFSTANMLANSDLFAAGIARSGSHNRTMTPWGFMNERRSLWQVPDVYRKVSAFFQADQINEPILFIHGQQDDSQASKPIHSHFMYQALRGMGATSKLVLLPLENHRYAARESILHAAAEMIEWFEIHLKGSRGEPSGEVSTR